MLILSDGTHQMISGTYPLPYAIFPKLRFFERDRRMASCWALIVIELALCTFFLYLISSKSAPDPLTAFSFGFPCLLTGLKYALQKNVEVRRENITVIGVAPVFIWVEHALLCVALALGALWANVMQAFEIFAPTAYTGIFFIAVAVAMWPGVNFLTYRGKSW